MCDFTSKYNMGTMVNKGSLAMVNPQYFLYIKLSQVSWVQNKDSKEQYGAKMYRFPVDNTEQVDDQTMIEKVNIE